MTIRLIENPDAKETQAIIEGVDAYGKSQVPENTPRKYAIHLELESELIGGIVGSIQFDRFYLSYLWVTESQRGSGHGSQLLEHCEKQMKALGCNSIILETLNDRAAQLYTKLGYRSVSRIADYVKGFDLVYFLKEI